MAAAVGLGPAGASAHRPDPHIRLMALPRYSPYFILPHPTSSYTTPLGSYDSRAALKRIGEREEVLHPEEAAVKHRHLFPPELLRE